MTMVKHNGKQIELEWDFNRDGSCFVYKVTCDCGLDITDLVSEAQLSAWQEEYAYEVELDRSIMRADALHDQWKDEQMDRRDEE